MHIPTPSNGLVIRFPHDEDPWALWDVLRVDGDHVWVRQHGNLRANQRRRLTSLSVWVSEEERAARRRVPPSVATS